LARAVLDANVYVSALIQPDGTPGRLMERFLRDEAFEVVLSLPPWRAAPPASSPETSGSSSWGSTKA
jgi:hypothetical protein